CVCGVFLLCGMSGGGVLLFFFFSSRRRHTRYWRDWSSDVCSSDLPARLVPDENLSLQDGAIAPWARGDKKLVKEALTSLGKFFGIDLAIPFRRLPKKLRDVLFYGAKKDGPERLEK